MRSDRPSLLPVRLASPVGRWTVAAAVLSSGVVFLESTVVTVALPSLGRDLGLGLGGLQWVVNGYLLMQSSLMLLGGSLGDLFGHRRVLVAGLAAFTLTCTATALAPNASVIIATRILQGAAGAILAPSTLALLSVTIAPDDRGTAIGRWAAWSAVSTALGPLIGGWLVDVGSWRWVFAVPLPFALLAVWIAMRRVPHTPARRGARRVDWLGAGLVTLGLAAVTWALIAAPGRGLAHPTVVAATVVGLALLAAFLAHEHRTRDPMLPLSLFRSRQFTGANIVTLLVYAAFGGLFFLFMLQLQNVLGYSGLRAGAALLPINVSLLLLSSTAGRIGQRIGPQWPIGVGALVAAGGLLLLAHVQPGASYSGTVLPALSVFGLGLAALVAPITAAVLGAVDDERGGVASAINNAAARLAGLLATAALPLAAGLGAPGGPEGAGFGALYARAMRLAAGLCALGAFVAFVAIRRGAAVRAPTPPSPFLGCVDPRGNVA